MINFKEASTSLSQRKVEECSLSGVEGIIIKLTTPINYQEDNKCHNLVEPNIADLSKRLA
jgi:hypothetical protein